MSDLDPELAAVLRRSADARIAEQIQAARERAEQQRAARAAFAARRTAGLRSRLAERHNRKDAP